jgi:pimeloyl-ACP methyl ester carboxylesterase
MKNFSFLLILIILFASCKKDKVGLSLNANEIFWLNNAGADMPVWVRGNTASKVMILFLHGGPGDGAYSYTDAETNKLWENYSFAYWDQRDAGSSAGNSNYTNLSFPQMVDDLTKLVQAIKYRYGNNMRIFLMGHSFGGLLGTAYLVEGNNQNNIKGWIEVDGAHDYPLSYKLESQMLIDTGTAEINKGYHVTVWNEIVTYCRNNKPNVSLGIDNQFDAYAGKAEGLFNLPEINTSTQLFSPSSPVSLAMNYYKINNTTAGKKFLESLLTISYTDKLNNITIPTLLLWGQYDFTVPSGCAISAMHNLGAVYKKLIIMPNCGHIPMNNNPDLFAENVANFIEAVK